MKNMFKFLLCLAAFLIYAYSVREILSFEISVLFFIIFLCFMFLGKIIAEKAMKKLEEKEE